MRKTIMLFTILTAFLAVSNASAWPPPDCSDVINYCW